MAAAPKHLIFDFGAVVFRWEPLALMQAVLPAHAPDAAAARALADRVFKGYTGAWGRFDAGLISREDLVPALAGQADLRNDEIEALIDAIPAHLQPLPATLALIDELQAAGHRLFFLSNMPLAFADHLEQNQSTVLRPFEDGVFSARVGLAKPDPAIFTLALRQFGVNAGDCVFLDDHPVNVEAARALGLGAVLFTDAARARPELQALGVPVAQEVAPRA